MGLGGVGGGENSIAAKVGEERSGESRRNENRKGQEEVRGGQNNQFFLMQLHDPKPQLG